MMRPPTRSEQIVRLYQTVNTEDLNLLWQDDGTNTDYITHITDTQNTTDTPYTTNIGIQHPNTYQEMSPEEIKTWANLPNETISFKTWEEAVEREKNIIHCPALRTTLDRSNLIPNREFLPCEIDIANCLRHRFRIAYLPELTGSIIYMANCLQHTALTHLRGESNYMAEELIRILLQPRYSAPLPVGNLNL